MICALSKRTPPKSADVRMLCANSKSRTVIRMRKTEGHMCQGSPVVFSFLRPFANMVAKYF